MAAHDSRVVAEGLWAVQLLLRLGTPIEQLFCCPELIYSDTGAGMRRGGRGARTRVFQVSGKSMHRIAERDTPEGLVAVVRMPHWPSAELRLSDTALIVVADGLENPGNLGTLLRTADGADAETGGGDQPANPDQSPAVFRASHGMSHGAAHRVAHPEDAIEWLRQHDCTIYLAAPGGGVHYRQLDCGGRTALVFGSERFGLSAAWTGQECRRVAIPMLGAADSLNVAAAAAIPVVRGTSLQEWLGNGRSIASEPAMMRGTQ